MSNRSMTYRVVAYAIVAGILVSLIPAPAWAIFLDTPNNPTNHISRPDFETTRGLGATASTAPETFADMLPAGVSEQMQSLGMIGPDGMPEGILFDQGAFAGIDSDNLPPSLSNPISISRIQSAYVPNALSSGVLEIEFVVTNNQYPTLAPQIPENATITETIAIISAFDFSADANTIRNVIIIDELIGATLVDSTPVAETSGNELIMNLGDIAPLDTVTATMQISVPSTGGQFVELDGGADVLGSLRGSRVIGQASPVSLAPDSFAEYFIDTPDADIDDEYMLNELAQIGGDVQEIFEYVQEFEYETYVGSLRGTRGTIWSEAGNSVDKASALIAMLRANGIPARYAHGTLFTQEAQVLIGSMFPEPVSVIGHIPDGVATASPITDPALIAEAIDHWWAQAYVNGAWVDLDPSFTDASVGQSFTTSVEELAELPDSLRHKVTLGARVEQYNAFPSVVGYDGRSVIRPLEATFNSVELVGKPVTFNQLVNTNVQGGFIFSIINHEYVPTFIVGEYEEVITGDTYQDTFSNIFGGLTNQVSLALWVEVTNTSPDGSSETYEREIIDLIGPAARQGGAVGDIISKRSAAEEPYVSPTDTFQLHIVAQDALPDTYYAKTMQDLLVETAPSASDALTELQSVDTNDNAQVASTVGESLPTILRSQYAFLNSIGTRYLSLSAEMNENLGDGLLVRNYTATPRLILLSQTTADSEKINTSFELLNVRQRLTPYPGQTNDSAFIGNWSMSVTDKSIELSILSDLGQTVVSGLSVVTTATQRGIELAVISSDSLDTLNNLALSDEAKARITEAVNNGMTVSVPIEEVPLDGELHIGWLEMDASGYVTARMEDGSQAGVLSFALLLVLQRYLLRSSVGPLLGFIFTIAGGLIAFVAAVLDVFSYCGSFGQLNTFPSCTDKGRIQAIVAITLAQTALIAARICMVGGGFACIGAAYGFAFVATLMAAFYANEDPPVARQLLSPQDDVFRDPISAFAIPITVSATLSGSAIVGTLTTKLANRQNFDSVTAIGHGIAASGTNVSVSDAALVSNGATVSTFNQLALQGPLTSILAQGSALAFNQTGNGSVATYAGSLDDLVESGAAQTTEISSSQPFTIEIDANAWTGSDGNIYDGPVTLVVSGTATLDGPEIIGARLNTDDLQGAASSGGLMVDAFTGPLTLDGVTLDAASSVAIGDFDGSLTIASTTPDFAQVAVNGAGDLFTVQTVSANASITPFETFAANAQITANFDGVYSLSIEAPEFWSVGITAAAVITAQPASHTQPGVYNLLVTAESVDYPGLFASTVQSVTIESADQVAVSVAPDLLTTIPMGETLDDTIIAGGLNAHIDNGQTEITNSAFNITVENLSTDAHEYDLVVSGLPAGWTLLSGAAGQASRQVGLAPGQSSQIGLYVSPPEGILPAAGTSYSVDVSVTATDDPALTATTSFLWTMPAAPFPYPSTPKRTYYAEPDSNAEVPLTLKNVGNTSGSFVVTTTVNSDIYQTEVYTTALIPFSPAEFTTANLNAGSVETQTITIDTIGATVGDVYIIESFSVGGEYKPTNYTNLVIVSAESLAAIQAAQALEDLLDSIDLDSLGDIGDQIEIVTTFTDDISDAIDNLVADLTDPDAKDELIDTLEDLLAGLDPSPAAESIQDVIDTLNGTTDPQAIADALTDLGTALGDLAEEFAVRTRYPFSVSFSPGVSGNLPGVVTTYTLSIDNQSELTATYGVTQTTPSGTVFTLYEVAPGANETILIPISAPDLGYSTLSAEIIAYNEGAPIPETLITRKVGFNVVNKFIDVLGVFADPAYVDVGAGSAEISAVIANVANSYRDGIAYTNVISPDGTVVFSSTTPIAIPSGIPATYPLTTVDASLLAEGTYTVTVDIRDETGAIIPDGSNYSFLGVGQSVRGSHSVSPELVPPGTVTVTTVITTEVDDSGVTTNSGGTLIAPVVSTVPSEPSSIRSILLGKQVEIDSSILMPLTAVITPTGYTRFESTDAGLTLNGPWSLRTVNTASTREAHRNNVVGSSAEFTFTGDWAGIGLVSCASCGNADIYINGVLTDTVDTYSRYDDNISLYYDLAPGTHTISVSVPATNNPNASNRYVYLDYVDLWDGTPLTDGRFEQNDPRVLSTSNWSNTSYSGASGGTYQRFGSNKWFPFTGDSVTFQGVTYNTTGRMEIEIDGEFQGFIDVQSDPAGTRSYSFDGLGPGIHVMRVHAWRGTSTVDAFETPAVGPAYEFPTSSGVIRLEEDHPDIRYNGAPIGQMRSTFDFNSYSYASRGFGVATDAISDTFSLTFEGTYLGIGLVTRANAGLAEIFINGVSQGIVDTYSKYDSTRYLTYDLADNGPHTVEVVALAQRGPYGSQNWVRLDYFDIWDGTTMPDETVEASLSDPVDGDQRIWRTSNWSRSTSGTASGGEYLRYGNRMWFPFTGDSVQFTSLSFNNLGTVEIWVDGERQEYVDLYSRTTTTQTFSFGGFGPGPHVIEVRDYYGNASIDTFSAPGTTPFLNQAPPPTGIIRHEEFHPNMRYNGVEYEFTSNSWTGGNYTAASGPNARYSRTLSDTVSLTFEGSWVALGFNENNNRGLAEVFIDGVSQGVIDTYSRSQDSGSFFYDIGVGGTHTVEIVVLDQRNPLSTDDFVVIDYIDVWDGTAMPDGTFEAVLEPNNGDPRVRRSSNWVYRTTGVATDGNYLRDGSRFWFPFTGDSVSFNSVAYSGGGTVNVLVDGVQQGLYDLYSLSTTTRTFSFDGFGAGPHTLEVRSYRGPANVDTFTAPGVAPFVDDQEVPQAITRYEDSDPAMRFNGVPWEDSPTSWSGGSYTRSSRGYARYSRTLSDTVSLTFEGSWVNVGLLEQSNAGIVEILIDGVSQGTFDTYSPFADTANYVFDIGVSGTHTVEVRALDQRNPNSSDDYLIIDYIDVWNGASYADGTFNATLDDYNYDQRIWRSSNWTQANNATATEGNFLRSGSRIWFPFTGDSFTYQALAYSSAGIVEVRIDGEVVGTVDLYNPATVTRTVGFENLGPGPHIVEIASSRGTAAVDGFATPGSAPFFVPPSQQSGYVRHEENDPGLRYNGVPFGQTSPTWGYYNYNWASSGYASASQVLSDTLSYTFDGDWVSLGVIERTDAGLAEVFIDGVSQGVIDLYSRFDDTQNYVYELAASGTHTIEVVVLDQRNPNSTNDWIRIDYIDTWDGTGLDDGTFEGEIGVISAESRIYRSNGWQNTNFTGASEGAYLRSGSRLWFPFEGDSITYQAVTYTGAGQVEIRIDGQSYGYFDNYDLVSGTRDWSFDGLGAGAHIFEIIARRGTATIDTFTTPGSAPFYTPPVQAGIIRYEENAPEVRYNGGDFFRAPTSWSQANFSFASRSYSRDSRTAGDTFSLTFDGSWVSLGIVERANGGLAEVFIDGVSQGIIDTYSRYDDTASYAYDLGVSGTHTIEVVVLDQRNPNASEDWVHFDYVDVWDGTAMPDGTFEGILEPYNGQERIWRSRNWSNVGFVGADDGTYIRNGSRLWFPFTGDSITYQAVMYTGAGRVEIRIDGESQGYFDNYNFGDGVRTWSFDGLGAGPHVMEIVARGGSATLDNFTTPGSAPFFEPPVQTGIVRYEENHPAIQYNGGDFFGAPTSWNEGGVNYGSRGYGRWSRTAGDTVSMTFEGSWVGLGFLARTNAGLAEVFIDGVSQGIIDTYSSVNNRTASFYYDLGASGTHTVEVVVLDQRSAGSDDWIHIDYIDVWDGTSMPSENADAILEPFNGQERIWRTNNWGNINFVGADNGQYLRDGSSVWYAFTGSSVNYEGIFYNGAGQVELILDGVSLGTTNLNQATAESKPVALADLPDGPHVLQVRAVSGRATVDGFTSPATPVGFAPIDQANDLAVDVGDPNTIPTLLTNYSPFSDTITVTISSEWPATVNPTVINLLPGESVVISPTIIVPPTVQVGETQVATVTTVSQVNGGFTTNNVLNLFAVDVAVQLCLTLDSSGSVSGADFELARQGLAAAFRDPTVVPRDGSVEFSLTQFPVSPRFAEVPPTVIVSEASAEFVANLIDTFPRQGGGTPLGQGINACTQLITNSPRFPNADQHVINLATDGQPTDGNATFTARTAAINAGITQINAEAIGSGASVNFLRDEIVYPQPGYVAPPFVEDQGGFVIPIATFEDFADSIREKLQFVFGVYSLDVLHTVPVTGTTILSPTIAPTEDAYITDTSKTDINWQYTQESGTTETLTFQTVLPDMQAGETRLVAEGTTISYTLSAGEVSQLVLPPLYVAAPHLIALNPPTRTVSAGATAAYTVTLYNLTDAPLPLTLDSAGVPSSWIAGLQDVVVPPNAQLDLPITITPPANADLTDYSFAVTVETDTGGFDQASALLTVVDGFNIDINPVAQTVLVGDATSYEVVIENPASVEQTYTLALDGLDATAAAALPPTVTIGAGEAATITLPTDAEFAQGVEPFKVMAVNNGGLMNDDSAVLEVIGETGVTLDISPPSQEGGPGAATLYTVTVGNTGDFIDTFDLVVDLPAGWTFEWQANGFDTTPLTLSPAVFNEAFLYLLITPPAGTAAGNYPFTVSTASSINGTATASDSAELVVLGQGVDIDIIDLAGPQTAGSPVTFDVVVTNSGTQADTFDLTSAGIAGAVGSFSQSSVSLAVGASTTVQLTIDTPDFVLPDSGYPVIATATSQTNGNATDNDISEIFFTAFEAVEVDWLPDSQEIGNGESIDYFFTISNTGNIPTEYALTFTTANGVTLTPEVNSITIPARLSAVVRVTADAASNASGIYSIVGTATATNTTGTDTATLIVTLSNQAPDAVDDSATTEEDVAVTVNLLGNDNDPDLDTLTIVDVSIPLNGTVSLSGTDSVLVTPDENYNGDIVFTYTISDGLLTDTATVTVTVTPVNDPPVAEDDVVTIDEDESATVAVLDNDSDIDGGALTVVSTTVSADATITINPDNTITVEPNANYNGTITINYTVDDGNGGTDTATLTVNVLPVNDDPVAVDDTASTPEETPVTVDVLANDSDIDGDTLGLVAITPPSDGSASIISGTVVYTPSLNFNGVVTFTYSITDGMGSADSALVTITVTPVNDAPEAQDDVTTTPEDTPVVVDVLDNDSDVDNDTLTVLSTTQPAAGTVTTDGSTVTFAPALNSSDTVSFTYTIGDGNGGTDTATVTVFITATNDAPVAIDDTATVPEDESVIIDVLDNDSDLDGDGLSISAITQPLTGTVVIISETVSYTPPANFNGVVTFTYDASDGFGGSDTAVVTVTVTPVNDAPVALDDNAATLEETAVTVDVLDNDSDLDGDTISIDSITQPTIGTATVVSGSIEYLPPLNFTGAISFTYAITDGNGAGDEAVVTITVAPVNDGPQASDDNAQTDEDSAVTIDVLANDIDDDGDPLTVTLTSGISDGVLAVNPDQTVTLTPTANFNGVISFTYRISDGTATDDATVIVTVNPVNDAPVAVDDATTTPEDSAVTVDVLSNDGDIDGDTLTVIQVDGTPDGDVVVNADNTVTFTPTVNFNGVVSLTYTVDDGNGGTDTALLVITVTPVNDAPIAVDDAATTDVDTAVTVDVLANDSDPDNDTLLVDSTTQPANGSVTIESDFQITYTPALGFTGSDVFDYTVIDSNGGIATATVTVQVSGAVSCDLYPIAVHENVFSGVQAGDVIWDITNGAGPGNFGWLSWNGQNSVNDLVDSLTPPGNSSIYENPDDSADMEVSLGDWVEGRPGVGNARKVRNALDALIGLEIVVPLYDHVRGQGSNLDYQVSGFATIKLVDYDLPSSNRITVEYVGPANCGGEPGNSDSDGDGVSDGEDIFPNDPYACLAPLDFEGFPRGTIISNQFAALGIEVSSWGGPAMIFDSANPTGGDNDLATPDLGNILIISEDGDQNDPDDNWRGGTFVFTFSNPASVSQLSFLDVEQAGLIEAYDAAGQRIASMGIPSGENNGRTTVGFNQHDVSRLEIHINGSGALTEMTFCAPEVEPGAELNACLAPVEDAYLQNGSRRYNNKYLRIESGSRDRESYLRFDLSAIAGTINSAELTMTVYRDPGNGVVTVYEGVGGNWTERNLNSQNRPNFGSQLADISGSFDTDVAYTFDVTSGTSNSVSDFIITLDRGGSADVAFSSTEGPNPPQLCINWTPSSSGSSMRNAVTLDLQPDIDASGPTTVGYSDAAANSEADALSRVQLTMAVLMLSLLTVAVSTSSKRLLRRSRKQQP